MFSFGMAMQSAFAFVVALFIACVFIVSVEESYKIGKWESAGGRNVMTNDELILQWDKLYSKRPDLEWEEIQEFNKNIQISYDSGRITKKEAIKFAALICYLGN